jgi:hypothetical protein
MHYPPIRDGVRPGEMAALAGVALAALLATETALAQAFDYSPAGVIIAADLNNADNPFVQPQEPALSGGGRDQTMQFGDVLTGSREGDLIIGRLGTDVIFGKRGADVMIGGPEHFNPQNRDRAFGNEGADIFVWSPGDGSDLFHGGGGRDAVVLGLLGELEDGVPVFRVSTDQEAGEVFIVPASNLPLVDVSNSPGFCDVIDEWSSVEAAEALDALDLDHLVRFSIRGVADAFEAGEQDEDNGLRVTLHRKGVEYVVCTAREGGFVEVLDLTVSPPALIALQDVAPLELRIQLEQMVQ